MKRVSRVFPLGLVSLSLLVGFHGASAFAATTISVATYGAQCDGVTDDTFAIQSALNAAAATGGGTVTLPGSTCLLNSFQPSSHPWGFYNLRIPSSVTLQGATGSKLLQGPGGRQLIGNIPGALSLGNVVVVAGNQWGYNSFQAGPFYNLQAMKVASPTVTLQTPSQGALFKAGDYVAIYEYTTGDVLPAQIAQLTAMNTATGQLTLADPVIRAFQTPSIANVTANAVHDTAINGVIVQGAVPLAVNETFRFNASNNQFLSDTSIGGNNVNVAMLLNEVEHFNFTGNTFAPVNGNYYFPQELGQRDSQNGVWDSNTFQVAAVGFGEYAANITMTNNHIFLHVDPNIVPGVAFGGQNVVFQGNDVHTIGNVTGGQGWGFVVTDVYAPGYYYAYTGNIQILNNTIQCVADGNSCLLLVGNGTTASGNTITATGWATGISTLSSAKITNNTINIESGTGILLLPWVNAATVAGNTLSGTGPFGIYVADPPTPVSGGLLIQNNTMQGFATHLYINLSLQPGAILSNNH